MYRRAVAVLLGVLTLAGTALSGVIGVGAASATVNPEQAYITHLYQDVLGRTPGSTEVTYWQGVLNTGPPFASSGGVTATMLSVATGFMQSTEYQSDLVSADYTTFLHRAADPGGLTYWTTYVHAGGTDQGVEAAFLASPEYFAGRGASNFDTWLSSVYSDVLGRSVDPASKTYWDGQHTAGVTNTAIATAIVNSPEARGDVVAGLYSKFLHRAPSTVDTAYWTAQMAKSMSNEMITEQILSSPEYYADSLVG